MGASRAGRFWKGFLPKGAFPQKKSFPLISATEFAMNAEIISVGTELLLGHTINTDAAFVARELSAIGVNLLFACTVGDNPGRLRDALEEALGRSDVVNLQHVCAIRNYRVLMKNGVELNPPVEEEIP